MTSSNWGQAYQTQGVLALGENIPGAEAGGGIAMRSGTSFAAPIVSGVVGVLMSMPEGRGSSTETIRNAILKSAHPCNSLEVEDCRRFLVGRLNIDGAVAQLTEQPAVTPSEQTEAGQESVMIPATGEAVPQQSEDSQQVCGVQAAGVATAGSEVEPQSCSACAAQAEKEQEKEDDEELKPSSAVAEQAPAEETQPCSVDAGQGLVEEMQPSSANVGEAHVKGKAPDVCHQTLQERRSSMTDQTQTTDMQPADCNSEGLEQVAIQPSAISVDVKEHTGPRVVPAAEVPVATAVPTAVAVPSPVATLMPSEVAPTVDAEPLIMGGVTPSQLEPSACGCGGSASKPPQLAYALGTIGYDFGTEGRRDAFLTAVDPGNAFNPQDFLAYLSENEHDAASVIWTLEQDTTPIYAIQPAGPFAAAAYNRIRELLANQVAGDVERVAIPGYVASSNVTLISGHSVPILVPDLRGVAGWNNTALCAAAAAACSDGALEEDARLMGSVEDFLSRVHHKQRNLGLSASDRAQNFAATNAFQAFQVFSQAVGKSLDLDSISAEPSPVCRPGADCWDVSISFFDPENAQRAGLVYRFAVDVSDVVPVMVDPPRSFTQRLQ